MSLESKVVWSEGMFLNPQHFQQQERYFERYVDGRCQAMGAYSWGFQELELDTQLLKLGKISLLRGKGVFPDGTPFSFPDIDEPPPVLELGEGLHDTLIYLALPVRRLGAVDVISDDSAQGVARYCSAEETIRDVAIEGGESEPVTIGKLRMSLLKQTDDLSGYVYIGAFKISETRQDKDILLDDSYIPTVMDCRADSSLSGFTAELGGMLRHRGEAIAGRLADVRRGGTAEIADYMLLQLVNRVEPLVNHLSQVNGLHPLGLFTELVQLIGEFSTFVAKGKRPPALPPYLHDDLFATFDPLFAVLRQSLTMVYEQTAISIGLEEKGYGIRIAGTFDKTLLTSASFVIVVRADVSDDVIRQRFPSQIKIGPVESIRQLVNAALPGIQCRPLPVAPRQIPFRSGSTYFELDQHSDLWKKMNSSGGFAFHVAGEFPGLEIEFWAVRR